MRRPADLRLCRLVLVSLLAASCGRAGMTLDLFRERHPGVLYSVEVNEPVVALTIDDGPDPETTPLILSALADNDARATFFLITARIPGNEALVAEIVEAGHELGNHLTRDEPSVDLSGEEFERELRRAHAALLPWGVSRWFRPGSGWHDDEMIEVVSGRGYRIALGSVYPLDATFGWPWLTKRFLLWRAEPGAVIILHDAGERGQRTARVLCEVLPALRERGYRVVDLSELVALAEREGEEN